MVGADYPRATHSHPAGVLSVIESFNCYHYNTQRLGLSHHGWKKSLTVGPEVLARLPGCFLEHFSRATLASNTSPSTESNTSSRGADLSDSKRTAV